MKAKERAISSTIIGKAQVNDRLSADKAEALEALRESDERFRAAFEYAAIGMALVGLNGTWIKVNPSLCRIVGFSEQELAASTIDSITHPDDRESDRNLNNRLINGDIPSYRVSKRFQHKSGPHIWVQTIVALVRDGAGHPLHFVLQVQDVTEQTHREWFEAGYRAVLELVAQDRPLADALGRLAEMIERQFDDELAAVFLVDDGETLFIAPDLSNSFIQALRPKRLRVAAALARAFHDGRPLPAVSEMATDPAWAGLEASAAEAGLQSCWAVPIQSGSDGTVIGLIAVFCRQHRLPVTADGTILDSAARLATVAAEHHQTTRQLAYLVRHDPLTGLPNRVWFEDRFLQARNMAKRSGKKVALFVMDIDRFKNINDTLGHESGDAVLQQFAHRVRENLRETDTLARMGGDEFMLILPECNDISAAVIVAEKIVASLSDSFNVGGKQLQVTSSIGIAMYPDDGDDSAAVQRCADQQMYRSKRGGRNGYCVSHSFP